MTHRRSSLNVIFDKSRIASNTCTGRKRNRRANFLKNKKHNYLFMHILNLLGTYAVHYDRFIYVASLLERWGEIVTSPNMTKKQYYIEVPEEVRVLLGLVLVDQQLKLEEETLKHQHDFYFFIIGVQHPSTSDILYVRSSTSTTLPRGRSF